MAAQTDTTVLFGGEGVKVTDGQDDWTYPPKNDTWKWTGATWTRLSLVQSPSPRSGHALAGWNGKTVLFGGAIRAFRPSGSFYEENYTLHDDTWTWDGATWTRVTTPNSPSPRYAHAMATLDGKIVLFGGIASFTGNYVPFFPVYLNDTWTWDGQNWTQVHVAGPPARAHHSMASVNGKIVLFGGSTKVGQEELGTDDTWTWDGKTWTHESTPNAPPARTWHAMATLSGKAVLFGGFFENAQYQRHPLNDTWTWDGKIWTKLSTSNAPPARAYHTMAAAP
jgi:N-acetylneuraminic acid mutarotase